MAQALVQAALEEEVAPDEDADATSRAKPAAVAASQQASRAGHAGGQGWLWAQQGTAQLAATGTPSALGLLKLGEDDPFF